MEKILYITGMHCPSCDLLVRETLHDLGGIEIVSLSEEGVLVYTSLEDDYERIKNVIEPCGYIVFLYPERNKTLFPSWRELLILSSSGILLRWILKTVDVTGYVAELGNNSAMGYGEMFFLGFIASLSTCLALVGGFVLMRGSLQGGTKESFRNALRHQGFFQLGRVGGYVLGGALLGRIGSALIFSPTVNGVINGIVSILLLLMGRNMLGWKQLSLPTWGGGDMLMNVLRHFSSKKRGGVVVGALTFFLPCGFTQVAQINALSTGSVLQGALLLGTFALGTLPVLLAIGLTGNRFQSHQNGRGYKLLGVCLVVLSLFLLQSSIRLLGW